MHCYLLNSVYADPVISAYQEHVRQASIQVGLPESIAGMTVSREAQMNCSSHLRKSLKIRLALFKPVIFLISRPVPIQELEALVKRTFLDAQGAWRERDRQI